MPEQRTAVLDDLTKQMDKTLFKSIVQFSLKFRIDRIRHLQDVQP